MSLNSLSSITIGLLGVVFVVFAIQAPRIIAEMEMKETVTPEQLKKYKKFLRPACIAGALAGFGLSYAFHVLK